MSVPVRPVEPVSPVLMGCALNLCRLRRSKRLQKKEAVKDIFGPLLSGFFRLYRMIRLFSNALMSFVSCEAHSRKRRLFYTQVWAVAMLGMRLAFLTPGSDKRKCGKLPLLKLPLRYRPLVWRFTFHRLLCLRNNVVTELQEEDAACSHVVVWRLAGSKLVLETSYQLEKIQELQMDVAVDGLPTIQETHLASHRSLHCSQKSELTINYTLLLIWLVGTWNRFRLRPSGPSTGLVRKPKNWLTNATATSR